MQICLDGIIVFKPFLKRGMRRKCALKGTRFSTRFHVQSHLIPRVPHQFLFALNAIHLPLFLRGTRDIFN